MNRVTHFLVAMLAALVIALPAGAQRVAGPHSLHSEFGPGDSYMGVQLQGALKLEPLRVEGLILGGLSALAYDRDETVLYALSDQGSVFTLELRHDEDGFLVDVGLKGAIALKDARGRALSGRRADAEGLALRNAANGTRGDTELVVSFERIPRVIRFDGTGAMVGSVALPAELRDASRYRTSNRGLESLVWHPRLGHLTAMEQDFKNTDGATVPLHALDAGKSWRYPLAAEPNAALTDALLLDDGTLLTLERGFGVFFVPFISSIRRIRELPDQDGAVLEVDTVARFNTGQGWVLDNFEGLAAIGDDRIVMVSDDNTRALQSTLLAQFRLLAPGERETSRREQTAATGNGRTSEQ